MSRPFSFLIVRPFNAPSRPICLLPHTFLAISGLSLIILRPIRAISRGGKCPALPELAKSCDPCFGFKVESLGFGVQGLE